MPRIVIVGGYGAFGSRVAERLARESDVEVVIAGRDGERAARHSASLRLGAKATIDSAVIDAERVGDAALAALAPTVVVNASGPFQGQDYRLARSCIAAGCHYVDLADARGFVTGIAALDADAKDAGVAIISGASSVPGVSSAVVAHFAPEFRDVEEIEIAISPGSGFEPGVATAAAGLSYLGQPISVPGRPAPRVVYGWQGLSRLHFPGLGRRWTAHCDVPDLDLFQARYPTLQRIDFRAGLEVGLFQIGLWLLSWPARIGLIAQPSRMASFLTRLKSRFSGMGSNRGGMRIAIAGRGRDGRPHSVLWSLAADAGDGLFVPTLACVILARRLARGDGSLRGAAPCFEMVSLEEVLSEVTDLRISTGPLPLYRRLLGSDFDHLPAAVRRLHETLRPELWRGEASVEHGRSPAARLATWLMPFPRETAGPQPGFVYAVRPEGDGEVWVRGFAGGEPAPSMFRTRQFIKGGRLIETTKGMRFVFRVEAHAGGQRLVLERLSVFGLPVPRVLHPDIRTLESERDGRYHFDVEAHLPLRAGLLVRYSGWLVAEGDATIHPSHTASPLP
ncbi:MAG: DUF4166 domain-containing protein [Hyphomicrobium sp.]